MIEFINDNNNNNNIETMIIILITVNRKVKLELIKQCLTKFIFHNSNPEKHAVRKFHKVQYIGRNASIITPILKKC